MINASIVSQSLLQLVRWEKEALNQCIKSSRNLDLCCDVVAIDNFMLVEYILLLIFRPRGLFDLRLRHLV